MFPIWPLNNIFSVRVELSGSQWAPGRLNKQLVDKKPHLNGCLSLLPVYSWGASHFAEALLRIKRARMLGTPETQGSIIVLTHQFILR